MHILRPTNPAHRCATCVVEAARQSALAAMVTESVDGGSGNGGWAPRSLDWMERSLRAVALPYVDHPDFEQEWLRL